MQNPKDSLEKSNNAFRKQIKGKLIGKISGISGIGFGEALYFRPYKTDEKLIEEIAEAMGEKKSAVAQKLLHLVLNTSPNESARENRQLELIGWLINHEKHKSAERDVQAARLDRLEEHAREVERNLIIGRAIAREILTEIEVARCKEEFADFKKHKDFQKFEVADRKTGEVKFVSLAEVRFDSRGSLFDQTLEYFLENREKRRTHRHLEKQVKEKGVDLKENLKSAKDLLKVAGEIAGEYKTKSLRGATRYLGQPIFTPKELMTIELRAGQPESKSEAAYLQKIFDSVDTSKARTMPAILQGFADEKESTKTINHSLPDEKKLTFNFEKEDIKSEKIEIEIRESKIEILNQEKGK